MKPFTFRLAGVLSLWRRKEENAQAHFQRQMAMTAVARVRERDARDVRDAAQQAAADAMRGTHAHLESAWHRNWITHLSLRVEAARDDVRRSEQNERAAKLVWQRAQRDRRVLERLRDRAQQRYRLEARRDEMKVMDALAQQAGQREHARW